jgi:hypothetical protein
MQTFKQLLAEKTTIRVDKDGKDALWNIFRNSKMTSDERKLGDKIYEWIQSGEKMLTLDKKDLEIFYNFLGKESTKAQNKDFFNKILDAYSNKNASITLQRS